MSSTYSSYNNASRCQYCGAPLAFSEPRCTNCGYLNGTPQPGSNLPQYQQQPVAPTWNQPVLPVQYEQIVPPNQSKQDQDQGLLKRYPAQPSNRYTPPPSSFQVPPQPYNAPYTAPPLSTGPTTPPSNFMASSQQALPPAPRSLYKEPKKRQMNIGKIVGVVVLLLVVLGGSFLAYTFLFPHKTTQQATSNTTTSYASPKGSPLFHDEFANNANGWNIQSYPGEFSVALGNGSLKLENDNNKLLWELVPGDKKYGDFQLSVDAVLSKGSQDNGYGVYIRGALSQNTSITTFYRFELYGDGSFAIFKGTVDANGVVTTPRLVDYTNSSAIQRQGSLNHITINTKGSSLQFIVNDQTLSTISDTTYTSGSIALFVSNLQKAPPGAQATFSHLAIYPAQK